MNQLFCCIRKDRLELIRENRICLFYGILFLISFMVLFSTKFFPFFIEKINENNLGIFISENNLSNILDKIFPLTLKENLGIWSSDVSTFFTFCILFICTPLLSREIKSGKWILVLGAGYHPAFIFISKIITYGLGASISVFIMYNLYYMVAGMILTNNFRLLYAFANGTVLAYAIFSIVNLVISLSVICKNQIILFFTIISTVMAAPDIFTLFSFGKILPTYVLTFVYNSSCNWLSLIVPCISLLFIQIIIDLFAIKKISTKAPNKEEL